MDGPASPVIQGSLLSTSQSRQGLAEIPRGDTRAGKEAGVILGRCWGCHRRCQERLWGVHIGQGMPAAPLGGLGKQGSYLGSSRHHGRAPRGLPGRAQLLGTGCEAGAPGAQSRRGKDLSPSIPVSLAAVWREKKSAGSQDGRLTQDGL